ncbi:MAG: hypothetical protein ACRCX2_01240, partial [Paraclostridium sp.]
MHENYFDIEKQFNWSKFERGLLVFEKNDLKFNEKCKIKEKTMRITLFSNKNYKHNSLIKVNMNFTCSVSSNNFLIEANRFCIIGKMEEKMFLMTFLNENIEEYYSCLFLKSKTEFLERKEITEILD